MTIEALKAELTTDPLGRGYSGMTDEQAAVDLNTIYRTQNRELMSSSEVMNAIDITEFNALTAADEALIWNVLSLGEINPFGVEATIFTNVFGGGSTTITTLSVARQSSVSRAQELGLGAVREGTVTMARTA